MPDAAKTKHRMVRISDERWDKLGDLAKPNRASVINAFIAWFLREPGADLPERPGEEPETIEFHIKVHRDKEHLWAEVDEMPGCFASGQTPAELRDALAEAMRLYASKEGSR